VAGIDNKIIKNINSKSKSFFISFLLFPDGGITTGQNLIAYVTDQDHGSGLKIFKVLKDDPVSGQEFMKDEIHYEYDPGDFVDSSGVKWKKYNLPTNLPDGTFYIRSFDRAGNDTLHRDFFDRISFVLYPEYSRFAKNSCALNNRQIVENSYVS
jgi:hypothetical protein